MVSWPALGRALLKEAILPLYSALVRLLLSHVSRSGVSSIRSARNYWGDSSRMLWRWLGDWNMSFMRKGWESWAFLAWTWQREDLICTNTLRTDVKRTDQSLFSGAQKQGTGQGAQTEREEAPCECEDSRLFCESGRTLEQVALGSFGVPSEDIQNPPWCDPMQCPMGDSALAGLLY